MAPIECLLASGQQLVLAGSPFFSLLPLLLLLLFLLPLFLLLRLLLVFALLLRPLRFLVFEGLGSGFLFRFRI